MYRFFVILSLAASALIAACNSTTDPVSSNSAGKDQSTIQANVVEHVNNTFTGTLYNECTSEEINYEIDVHYIYQTKTNADGSTSLVVKIHVKGKGWGVDSGNKYEIIENGNFTSESPVEGCPTTYSQTIWLKLTTPGGQNNLSVKATYSYTLDCDGNFIPGEDSYEAVCQ